MPPAFLQPWRAWRAIPDRQRLAIMVLVALLHLLLLFLLLRLAPPEKEPPKQFVPLVVTLTPQAQVTPSPSQAAKPKAREKMEPPPRPKVRLDTQKAPVSSIWSQVIPLTREEMARADIGRMPTHPVAPADAGAGASAGDSTPVGKAPNGQPMYAARWYREPTNAELGTYLPPAWHGQGYGVVACRMIADYRVEDCEEIGQSQPGLAGAVRKAAWQFRVIPPRVGGKSMVGTWVRILIEYDYERVK